MISKEITVNNPTGLHARPATLLVKRASSFQSDISIVYQGKKANAKSLIGVLSLGVVPGSPITIHCDGQDEEEALKSLTDLIEHFEE